jgi:hypothetical protein
MLGFGGARLQTRMCQVRADYLEEQRGRFDAGYFVTGRTLMPASSSSRLTSAMLSSR